MKVQVLQGVNLENSITTIKIELDATPKVEIIDLIKSYHPIFMEKYSVEGNMITIVSKLPHFWKEMADPLNKYALGEINEAELDDIVHLETIKPQILSMSTIPILDHAMKQNYEITQTFTEEGMKTGFGRTRFNRYYTIGCGSSSDITISIASTGDSHFSQAVQRNKWATNTMLDRLKLPIAKWEEVEKKEDFKKIWDNYTKPVVVKPVGLVGGSGVVTKIKTIKEAEHAFDIASKAIFAKERPTWQTKIMIQEQVPGEDYRLLVINGILRIATKRIPAHVIGDGKKTLKQLIEITNAEPRRNKRNPSHTLKPIEFDQLLDEYIEEQGFSYDYIPKEGEKVFVRKVSNMSQGGMTEDFTDKIHPQIKAISEALAASLHSYVLGVDLYCEDTSQALNGHNGTILEANTMPESYLNAFPSDGKQYPQIGQWVVEGLREGKTPTKKIVVIGGDKKKAYTASLAELSNPEKETVGMYSNTTMYLQNEAVKKDVEAWRAIEALKINASLTTIILHYPTIDEVKAFGLGFDQIDKVILLTDLDKQDEKTLGERVSANLISKIIK